MDDNIAINVENIGKCYRIGVKKEMRDNFLSTLIDTVKSPISNYKRYRSLYRFSPSEHDLSANNGEASDLIWALRGVSFEVEKGELLGIIGNNGAGKSTLLKILSRITDPTIGSAMIKGRVSSLLEVGTGFHPELTGRENIYLNGTILGMRKREVDRKLDEIIDFSGIEKFIDTPIKRFSSGMKLRLAFSVAAHLEPEILIIDEVLAVGDASFQKKCLNKMETVGGEGRTVLFVSHNMQAVSRLCPRTILLEKGDIIKDGPSGQVISQYLLSDSGTSASREWSEQMEAPGGEVATLRSIKARDEGGQITEFFDIRKPIFIDMEYEVIQAGHLLMPHLHFYNDEGVWVFTTIDTDPSWKNKQRPLGRYTSTVLVPGNLLSAGTLYVTPSMITLDPQLFQYKVPDAIAFNVIDTMDADSARGNWHKDLGGVVRPKLDWFTEYSDAPLSRNAV